MLGEKRLKGATGDSPGTPASDVHWNSVFQLAAEMLHSRGVHIAPFRGENVQKEIPSRYTNIV